MQGMRMGNKLATYNQSLNHIFNLILAAIAVDRINGNAHPSSSRLRGDEDSSGAVRNCICGDANIVLRGPSTGMMIIKAAE